MTRIQLVFSQGAHSRRRPHCVPNTQLNGELYSCQGLQGVAEQNSVDLCWDLLMDSSFDELLPPFYSTDERRRFRQLVVNSVMATDIMDKELKGTSQQ
jgi:hypothetical protein